MSPGAMVRAKAATRWWLATRGDASASSIRSFAPIGSTVARKRVRETCDWFCLPEYRALGVGLHLMRRMMAKPEPILVIGGTDATQNLLPRLKWARLPDVGNFILGVSARTVAGLVAHSRWQGGVEACARCARHPVGSPAAPRAAAVGEQRSASPHARRSRGDAEHRSLRRCARARRTRSLDWLARAPAVLGQFVLLSFFCDGEPVGILDQPAAGASVLRPHVADRSCACRAARNDRLDGQRDRPRSHRARRRRGLVPRVLSGHGRAPCPRSGFGGESRARPIGGPPTGCRRPDRSI